MTNLLPQEAQRRVRRFYRDRMVMVGSLVAISCAALTFLGLVPAYVLTLAPETDVGKLNVAAGSPVEQADMQRAQQLLRDLAPIATSSEAGVDAIASALSNRPTGVKITSVAYVPGTVTLEGSAPSRDSINAYALALRSNERFKSVSVPLGALTTSGESAFSITVSGTF